MLVPSRLSSPTALGEGSESLWPGRWGLQLQHLEARGPDEFDGAFAVMAKEHVVALLVLPVLPAQPGHRGSGCAVSHPGMERLERSRALHALRRLTKARRRDGVGRKKSRHLARHDRHARGDRAAGHASTFPEMLVMKKRAEGRYQR